MTDELVVKRGRGRPKKVVETAPLVSPTADLPNVRPAIFDPEHYPEDAAFAARHPVPRQPDAAFFADLPVGFVPPRRADYLADVIVQVNDFRTDAEKVIWLRHNTSPALTYLLRLAFSGVEWLIPTGVPIYKQWTGRRYSSPSELKRELRRLYLFVKGGNDAMSDIKRQKLFAQTIEGLESTEVGVLVALKDQTLDKDYGLTAELVNLAFPGILDAPFTPKFIR